MPEVYDSGKHYLDHFVIQHYVESGRVYSLSNHQMLAIVTPKPAAAEPTHDLAWAVSEMVRNPMKEYIGHYSDYTYRFDIEEGGFRQKGSYVDWGPAVFTELDLGCTEWRAVAKPAEALEISNVETLNAELRRLSVRVAELEKRQ